MIGFKTIAVTIVALTNLATAQNFTSSSIIYNNSQVIVRAINQYANTSLSGSHVGAALSYMVSTTGSGFAFAYNSSATSAQLLNNDIASQYQLPCYVINTPQISNNSGPLQCGAGDQEGYYDVASISTAGDGSPVKIDFDGIKQWYICAAYNSGYGWIQRTVVGAFNSGVPSGPGIQNCTSVDGLAFPGDNSVMPPSMTAPSNYSMTTSATLPDATDDPLLDPAMTESKVGDSFTVTVTAPCTSTATIPTPSVSAQPQNTSSPSASAPILPEPSNPITPYTGAASTIDSSAWIGIFLAAVAFHL